MAISSITGVTNATLWDLCREFSPHFKSHTSKGTADLFTEKGFEALRVSDIGAINEFFEISMRVVFQKLTVGTAKNIFEGRGLVEVYNTPNGGYTQRLAIDTVKPVSPAYKGLKDYESVDPFVIKKPSIQERFFQQNFDYQSLITIQDFQVKPIFVSEYGMGEFIAGVLEALAAGRTVQEYENTLAVINAALNSTTYQLQDTQVVRLSSWTASDPTAAQLTAFILAVKDTLSAMVTNSQTGAFNALGFKRATNNEDLVMLVRANVRNRLDIKHLIDTTNGVYNPKDLEIPIEVIEVDNFGGLQPYTDGGESDDVLLQPVYDKLGSVVGYIDASVTVNGAAFQNSSGQWLVNITSGVTTADTTFPAEPDLWKDPNEKVIGVIMRKGAIFENVQNAYQVSPIWNPRGQYNNFWASAPNNTIAYDPLYEVVAICAPNS